MTRIFPLVLASMCGMASSAAAQDLLWTRQLGTSAGDSGRSVALDHLGNAYVVGITFGSLGGSNAGGTDALVAKYDRSGSLVWNRQLGTSGNDDAFGVAVDSAGNAYVTGYTNGTLGGPNLGGIDAFLTKYDASGNQIWIRQFGSNRADEGRAVCVDGAGNIFVTGSTDGSLGGTNGGVFLVKYDSTGALLWTRQFGSTGNDDGFGVAADTAGNVFVAGVALSNPFLTKYDGSGSLLWFRGFGISGDGSCSSVAVDGAGNAYIAGETNGSLAGPNAGLEDLFLAKYSPTGSLLWTRQVGTGVDDVCNGLAADAAGNTYLTGWTNGGLGGPNQGSADAYIAKFDTSGSLQWTRQLGTTQFDIAFGIAVNNAGDTVITGNTFGSFMGTNAGGDDLFLARYAPFACYPNCDGSTTLPILNNQDFQCFINAFASGDAYANCDESTVTPILTPNDFMCFMNKFAAGCS